MTIEPFALLDESGAGPAGGGSRLLSGYEREYRCIDPLELDAVCAAVQADLELGMHALLVADYEWGVRLMQAQVDDQRLALAPGALRFLVFRHTEPLDQNQVRQWLQRASAIALQDTEADATGFFGWKASVDEHRFAQDIAAVQRWIREGETYQINYTYRTEGWALGHPVNLYRLLRERQPVPYGALIRLPPSPECEADEWLLSLSPELFLRFDGQKLTAQPMKGTASCPANGQSEAARALSADPKNRAENVMIVDLMRNDLGRISSTGTVRVPHLFQVERHGSVLQMTSTVEAILEPGRGLADIIRATFPCGSITGAPKRRAVELIARLEQAPRGPYTGAIGWLGSASRPGSPGPFCMSVAIRTLALGKPRDGRRRARFGVGAGIVADSVAAHEWEECRLKGRFVMGMEAGFMLTETLYVAERSVPLLEWHLKRLRGSAEELGFTFDGASLRNEVDALVDRLGPGEWRLRLRLASDGRVDVTVESLAPLEGQAQRLLLACEPYSRPLWMRRHKTTMRQFYDAGVASAVAAGAFDTLFHQADGTLVEGGRSTLLVRIGGQWCTPPVQNGALPGVLRAVLEGSGLMHIVERPLLVQDLRRASSVIVCNALRGVVPVRAVGDFWFDEVPQAIDIRRIAEAIRPLATQSCMPCPTA
jgi:para-aminobenzoate synthetase / 4-amino-4-deoxychorismate lyase